MKRLAICTAVFLLAACGSPAEVPVAHYPASTTTPAVGDLEVSEQACLTSGVCWSRFEFGFHVHGCPGIREIRRSNGKVVSTGECHG